MHVAVMLPFSPFIVHEFDLLFALSFSQFFGEYDLAMASVLNMTTCERAH